MALAWNAWPCGLHGILTGAHLCRLGLRYQREVDEMRRQRRRQKQAQQQKEALSQMLSMASLARATARAFGRQMPWRRWRKLRDLRQREPRRQGQRPPAPPDDFNFFGRLRMGNQKPSHPQCLPAGLQHSST